MPTDKERLNWMLKRDLSVQVDYTPTGTEWFSNRQEIDKAMKREARWKEG
jgi:hypothetical protein